MMSCSCRSCCCCCDWCSCSCCCCGIVCVIPGDKSAEEFSNACGAGGEDPVPPFPVPIIAVEPFLREVGDGALILVEAISSSIKSTHKPRPLNKREPETPNPLQVP